MADEYKPVESMPESEKQRAAEAAMGTKDAMDQNAVQGKDMAGEKPEAFQYGESNPRMSPAPEPTPDTPAPDPPQQDAPEK